MLPLFAYIGGKARQANVPESEHSPKWAQGFNHEEFKDICLSLKYARQIVSHYYVEPYITWFKGWHVETKASRKQGGHMRDFDSKKDVVEALFFSPNCGGFQLSLSRRQLINQAVATAPLPEWRKDEKPGSNISYGKETIPIYQTHPIAVRWCLSLTPFQHGQTVMDVGSGSPPVFYNELANFPVIRKECEITRGQDFFLDKGPYDWCVGNPPFEQRWDMVLHCAEISSYGFALLFNMSGVNALTPNRRETLKEIGFYQQRDFIFCDKRWFGRYHWLIFTREENFSTVWHKGTFK